MKTEGREERGELMDGGIPWGEGCWRTAGERRGEVEKEHSSGLPPHEWWDDSRSAGQEAVRRKNGVKGRWVEGGRLAGVMLVF